MDKENSNLLVYKLAMEEVATVNLKESAERLGLEYDKGGTSGFFVTILYSY